MAKIKRNVAQFRFTMTEQELDQLHAVAQERAVSAAELLRAFINGIPGRPTPTVVVDQVA